MKQKNLALLLTEGVLTGCCIAMSIQAKMPLLSLGALALLGVILMAAEPGMDSRWPGALKWAVPVAWACTLIVFWCPTGDSYTWDYYSTGMAWLMAAAVLIRSYRGGGDPRKSQWRQLGVAWSFFGSLILMTVSYSRNMAAPFYAALAVAAAFLILGKFWFQMSGFGINLVNTLILLFVGLPIADFFLRPPARIKTDPAANNKLYSYDAAKKYPVAFTRWWEEYLDQWERMGKQIFVRDPAGFLPFRLRTNSQAFLFQSLISINSRGFRGREISEGQGRSYRIVALGESTTFGCTLNPEDKPWPELLEKMIRERLNPPRPVEVINAGVPAYTLQHNLYRLPTDILPLKPDMIISYHGYNGFNLLNNALPPATGPTPPRYEPRPIKLLGDLEYRLRMIAYKRRLGSQAAPKAPTFSGVMETPYAAAYRNLIQLARAHEIRLVLANFSMAVNRQSGSDLLEFYRAGFPLVPWQIEANVAHSMIVDQLAQDYAIPLVDTHSGLDGKHVHFIDLVHLTQKGRQQLAETFLAGITNTLAEEWAKADLVRVPR